MNFQRDKSLEHIRYLEKNNNYKTFVSLNNSSYCGGLANYCNDANDCCGGSDCINNQCTRE